ncbi:MAG TPA: hypothetical protein DCQ47_02670 [Gammaproteobacteria bacterium]|nr:hypothetical protein [Gammaproteobacteria bacterium]
MCGCQTAKCWINPSERCGLRGAVFSGLSNIANEISFTNVIVANETYATEGGITNGLCHLPCLWVSASVLVKENASNNVQRNLMKVLDRVASSPSGLYGRDIHAIDDMPVHLRIPIIRTHGMIGTWTCLTRSRSIVGNFLLEHRQAGFQRRLKIYIAGSRKPKCFRAPMIVLRLVSMC